MHNEAPSVAMSVNNPERSPFDIQTRDPAQIPFGFAEIFSLGARKWPPREPDG